MTPYYADESVTLYLGDCRELIGDQACATPLAGGAPVSLVLWFTGGLALGYGLYELSWWITRRQFPELFAPLGPAETHKIPPGENGHYCGWDCYCVPSWTDVGGVRTYRHHDAAYWNHR